MTMSLQHWLQNLRSALVPGRGRRHHGRSAGGGLRGATYRPHVESLEDRRLLAFLGPVLFDVGPNPQAVVTTDFNNDGSLDLATANSGGNSVSVLLGDGQGGFGAANHFAAGTNPRSIVVADFNNDGNLDVATGSDSSVSVLLGNGDGTFRPRIGNLASAIHLAAGDFNADGNTDLMYTFRVQFEDIHGVNVMFGDGQGRFAVSLHQRWVELYEEPSSLVVANLGGGSRPVGVTSSYDGTVTVLIWADGVYDQNYASGQESSSAVAVGDFTGDGIPDLVNVGEMVTVLPGLGNLGFASPVNSSGIGTTVAVTDFNGDGKLDVVTSDTWPGTVKVLLGLGDGTFSSPIDHAVGSSPWAVTVGDFNGDGLPDVAAADLGSNTVSVLLNDGAWSPDDPPSISISDTTVTEGNTGTVNATFTLTLSRASTVDVAVHYDSADVNAVAGSDYTAASGDVIIPAGQTTATFTVAVLGDRLVEPTETFAVNLSAPTNAMIRYGHGIGTILDNEPRISISDMTKSEGKNRKTTLFTFTVTLSAAYDQPVTMSFRTVNGTATTGDGDYIAKSGTLTFAPGETTKTITIEVKGDNKREANETFYLDLFANSSNSQFTKNRGLGTILNDD